MRERRELAQLKWSGIVMMAKTLRQYQVPVEDLLITIKFVIIVIYMNYYYNH